MSCDSCRDPCISRVPHQVNARLKPRQFFICRFPSIRENITPETELAGILQMLVDEAVATASLLGLSLGQGSINRNRGEIYEMLLYLYAWESVNTFNATNGTNYFLVKLPSSTPSNRFVQFFTTRTRECFRNVPIYLPNPDLLAIHPSFDVSDNPPLDTNNTESTVQSFVDGYRHFRGRIEPEDVVAVVSIKTTTRPDRRYQCIYEAHVIDSIFQRVDTYVPYFVFGLSLTQADKEVMQSPPVQCISCPDCNDFRPIIDKDYDITRIGNCSNAITEVLSHHQSGNHLSDRTELQNHWSSLRQDQSALQLTSFME